MKKFKHHTLMEFVDQVSKKEPVPGGGAVAALCAANGAALIVMTARYSVARADSKALKQRLQCVVDKGLQLQGRFLDLVDLDAQAYLEVVKARNKSPAEKRKAKKKASAAPREIARLCRKAMDLTPLLVTDGSPYLLSDVEVAVELLYASYRSAMINLQING